MLLRRFYDTKLAQASYMIGCQATGDAIVVDANRDIAQYIAAAAAEGLRITHVTETHIHADFVSGSRELAHRTGAQLLLSDEGDADWKYLFATTAEARLLHDGDIIMVGNIRLDVMHTPGHTPEHLSFIVTDTPAAAGPMGVLTGDFVFVGDVGRPDLLEKAAHISGTMDASARTLFHSLQRFKRLPDHLQLWPGHGAGSACGKALGAVPSSTLGYEKVANWGLKISDEQTFVDAVLDAQPEPPLYFAEMKRINKSGPALHGDIVPPPLLDVESLAAAMERGVTVVDTRPPAAFAAAHIPGALNIPFNGSFTTWAGWLMAYDARAILLTDAACASCVNDALHDLAMIGLDTVEAYVTSDVIMAWTSAGRPLVTVPQIDAVALAERMKRDDVTVIDVRGESEFAAGHLPGARHIPVGYLTSHLDTLPTDRTIVVQCQSGARSAIAASVLQAHGVRDVVNLSGGFVAWVKAQQAVRHEPPMAGVRS
jgi:hydroxyacylglutathione hydrolase